MPYYLPRIKRTAGRSSVARTGIMGTRPPGGQSSCQPHVAPWCLGTIYRAVEANNAHNKCGTNDRAQRVSRPEGAALSVVRGELLPYWHVFSTGRYIT